MDEEVKGAASIAAAVHENTTKMWAVTTLLIPELTGYQFDAGWASGFKGYISGCVYICLFLLFYYYYIENSTWLARSTLHLSLFYKRLMLVPSFN